MICFLLTLAPAFNKLKLVSSETAVTVRDDVIR